MSFDTREFQGVNEGYFLELYESWQRDPLSVDVSTRELFARFRSSPTAAAGAPGSAASERESNASSPLDPNVVVSAINLAQSIRRYGHLAANIDPLGQRRVGDPALLPETHGVTEADLRSLPAALIHGDISLGAETMWDVVERLRGHYCGTVGYDIAHIFVPEERKWLRDAVE